MRGGSAAGVVAVAGAVALAGCGGKERQTRSRDAAPVVVVTQGALADPGQGQAADEVEPNDGVDVATALALGHTGRGRIEAEADVDLYALEVTEAGALAVELGAVEGVDLTLEVADAAGTVLARSDRGGARTREGVPNLGVTPGRYLAIVRAKKPAPAARPRGARGKGAPAAPPDAGVPAGPAPVYELTARVAPPPSGAEREPDGDRGTAVDLIVGDTVTGFIGWTGDADVWKLSVEALAETNVLDVEVSPVEGLQLALELTDGVGAVLVARKAPRGGGLVARGLRPVLRPGAPPFYYLTLRADRSNPETAYQLRVAAKVAEPDAELEPNDALDRAMALPADRTSVAAAWSPGDVDCFALPADPAARSLVITIDTPPALDLAAELLVDGKVVGRSAQPGKGAAERVTAAVPAGAAAVLRVTGAELPAAVVGAAAPEGTYRLTVEEGPPPAP